MGRAKITETPVGCAPCANTGLKDGNVSIAASEVCPECNGSPFGEPVAEAKPVKVKAS